MTNEEIIDFWGGENLIRWPESALRTIAIPEKSKIFLAQVGMPNQKGWTLHFESGAGELNLGYRRNCRRIGFDDVVPICLDEDGQGRVIAAEQAVGGKERYINSSVEAFGACLVQYQTYRNEVRTTSEEQIPQLVDKTEKSMRSIDGSAFESIDNYWPVIIEQMRQGLL
jgi:SUKH-4 immunity protein